MSLRYFFGLLVLITPLSCDSIPEIEDVLLISKENSPFIINKDFNVEENTELKVTAGAKILVDTGVTIKVFGKATIIGTEEEPVEIKPIVPGVGWDQIKVYGKAHKFTLKHAIIEDGRIMSSAQSVEYDHVTFYNKQNLAWDDALSRFWSPQELKITNCKFNANNKGEGLLIHDAIEPEVSNCQFHKVPDGVEYLSAQGGIIKNNSFHNGGDDAIDLNNCEKTIVEDNLINGYRDRGMEIGGDGFGDTRNIIVRRNILTKCRVGIRLKDDSQGEFINNTFYNNQRGFESATFDKEVKEGSDATLINCIFYKNREDDWRKDQQSKISLSYCISESRDLNAKHGENNLKGDPLLIDPDAMNFGLFPESPCIDAGDPNSEKDKDGSISDIGAVAYNK